MNPHTVVAQRDTAGRRDLMATVRRLPALVLISVSAAAVVMWDEVLLAGPIIFLTETLGFLPGLLTFALAWASIGIAGLLTVDFIWPAASRGLRRLSPGAGSSPEGQATRSGASWTAVLGAAAVSATVIAAGAGYLVAGDEALGWAEGHRGEGAAFLGVALLIFLVLALVDWAGRGIERWVRRIAATAGPRLRTFSALVTMVYLGPVLGWGLFRLLGYTRRSTYALTVLAAPVFAAIWVAFYSLGIWRILERWL